MTYQEVSNIVFSSGTKPWQRKEWRNQRKDFIKEQCEQCGSKQQPLVLQHFWHPKSYKKHIREIYPIYYQKVDGVYNENEISDKEIQDVLKLFTETRDACPSCQKISINERKTMTPKYRCGRCKIEFDKPIKLKFSTQHGVAPHPDELRKKLVREKTQLLAWEKYEVEIKTEAVIRSIDDSIRYLTNWEEDTKTFCKRCAFLWDKYRKKPCKVCGEKLVSTLMHACYKCQQEGHPGVLIE